MPCRSTTSGTAPPPRAGRRPRATGYRRARSAPELDAARTPRDLRARTLPTPRDAGGHGSSLPPAARALALLVFAAGYAFALSAMRVNPHVSTVLRVGGEGEHAVVGAGPYARVRHPGYAGTILAHLALPAALGSARAYAPALAGALLFVLRIAREDRVLAGRLPGYRDYRARVPWRLLPRAW